MNTLGLNYYGSDNSEHRWIWRLGYAWQIINAFGGAGQDFGYNGDMAGDAAVKATNNLSPQAQLNFANTLMIG